MKVNPYNQILKPFSFLSTLVTIFACLLLPALAAAQATVVQVNSSANAFVYRNSVVVPFASPETAGNLNVIVVGWNDTSSTIATVADSNGNTYLMAAGTESTAVPASGGLGVSQAIYYAKNINGGADSVQVTFNQSTSVQSIRIAEYSGLDTVSPLDTGVSSTGTASPADSGAAVTNSANDLLFGAGTVTSGFTASGAGYVTRLLNGLNDIIEDQSVAAAGSYDATAVAAAGSWVMQLVAFRVAGQTIPVFAAPTITSLSVATGAEAGGVPFTITGTNFQSGATVLFSNTSGFTASAVNCSVTSATTITCLSPSFPTGTASVAVTNVDGQTTAPSPFTVTPSTPFATAVTPSITPDTGTTNGGTVVTIAGSDFAAGANVTVGGIPADRVSVQNANTITASLPAGSAALATVIVRNTSGTAGTLPGGYTYATVAGINFIQVNSAHPASPAATATVTYPLPQTAGNLNVVIIGWGDATNTVQSVVDSASNTYTLAFAPTVGTGLSQAVYYAKNINTSASNTVTVTFSAAATTPDVRVLEYSGLDTTAPLDAGAGAFGTGTALDSGPITTSVAGDLVIGSSTTSGIVVSNDRVFTTVTSTPSGLSVEHLVGPAAGVIDATATQDSSANWVTQAVAFKQNGVVLDFGITALPATASVAAGASTSFTVSVSPINSFVSPVTLTCAGLPLGSSCAFSPAVVSPAGAPVNSNLIIATTAVTPLATSTVTITGTAGALTHDATVGLTVTAAPPPPPADFSLGSSPLSPASIAAGAMATSTITVGPLNGFTGDVALTCAVASSVSRAPTCAVSPASVTGGTGTATLTVSTTAATTASLAPRMRGTMFAMWMPIGGLALLGAGFGSRKKKLWGLLLAGLMFSGIIFLVACGGSSSSGGGGGTGHPGTPAGSYNVTVTGTSGSLTHTATVSVTVQ